MLLNELSNIKHNNEQVFFHQGSSNPWFFQYNADCYFDLIKRGMSYKHFVDVDDRRLFFKQTTYLETLGEIISAELGRELGLNIVDPIPVECVFSMPYNDVRQLNGVIMSSYIPKQNGSVEMVSARRLMREFGNHDKSIEQHSTKFTAYNLLECATKLKRNGYLQQNNIELSKSFTMDHIKLVIFDMITFETDRHNHNIEYLLKKREDGSYEFGMSPIFDNSLSFGLTLPEKIRLNLFNDARSGADVSSEIGQLFSASGVYLLENSESCFNETARDIAKIVICNKELQEFVNTIASVNIDSTIFHAMVKGRVKMSSDLKFIAKEVFNFRRQVLLNAIEKEKLNQNNQSYSSNFLNKYPLESEIE